jgi:hypothetical protein
MVEAIATNAVTISTLQAKPVLLNNHNYGRSPRT